MTETHYKHDYKIGDAVLAELEGVRIPGVISDKQGDRIMVQLAQPWSKETDQASSVVALTADKLEPYIGEETGGTKALPKDKGK